MAIKVLACGVLRLGCWLASGGKDWFESRSGERCGDLIFDLSFGLGGIWGGLPVDCIAQDWPE